ncbi:flagellar motor protein MotB [Desulfovibrio sp. OttesenSCG-928-G11]|nr:flagellar motor protein MotB [Desulfovibrio sp. OttesenSCG-928-G11]
MAGSSWKVAYADFMTAMMAFFLVMWLLNMAPQETLAGLSSIFKEGKYTSSQASPYGIANNPLVQYVDKLDNREFKVSEIEESHYAIAQSLKQFILKDALPSSSSGITSDGVGVLLHITSNLMFQPGTEKFTVEGEKVMQEVLDVMNKYKVYLVVRGHADISETGAPYFPSKWELSAARGNSAVRWLIEHGVKPSLVRSVAYADTRPQVPPTVPGAAAMNSRVEFNFHRPEVMSTIVGY